MKKYSLARPYIQQEKINAVVKVLKSGHLSLGPVYQEFEKAFAKKIGTKYAIAVSSGTAGLHLAMLAAGIKAGDEVVTTPFSFVASGNCILYVGAKPVFVDIDPVTYNMDPDLIEKAITPRTKAILVVHIFGQAADMKPILSIAKKHKLKIIEDACESIEATYYGKKTGTFGESAVFAFYPNKQMTTGEGGMIVTNSKKVADQCKSLANQGRGANMQWLDHQYLGYNYRLDEMSAALGLVQLKRLDWMIKERQKIAAWYAEALQDYSDLVQNPKIKKGNSHTWFVYVVALQSKKAKRDTVIKQLAARGVASKPYLPSIHLFDFYRRSFGYKPGVYPVSEKLSDKTIALPLYIGLTKHDVGQICKELINILAEYA
jgi:perosamine synthetase